MNPWCLTKSRQEAPEALTNPPDEKTKHHASGDEQQRIRPTPPLARRMVSVSQAARQRQLWRLADRADAVDAALQFDAKGLALSGAQHRAGQRRSEQGKDGNQGTHEGSPIQ